MPYSDDRPDRPQNDFVQPQIGFGHPVYDQIGSFYKQYTGQDPHFQDVSGWGTNVDSNYMEKIRQAIYNSGQAQAYRTKQLQTPQTQPSSATGSPVTASGGIPPAQAAPAQPAAPPPQAPKPAEQGATPNQTRYVQPVSLSGVPAPQPYTAPTGPLTDQGVADQQTALMRAVLANPQTMSPSIIGQLEEKNKEQALLMRDQGLQNYGQNAVARGVGLGTGAQTGYERGLTADTIGKILSGNRDIETQAAQTNRQDELNALAGATGVQNSALQRAIAGEQLKQAGADSSFRNTQSALDRQMAQWNINQGVAGNAQQNYNTDLASFMNLLQYMENQRQFNNQLGFNYNSLDQSGQNTLLNYLTSISR